MQTADFYYSSFIPLEIWDVPGSFTLESLGVPLSTFATIIFVIDIQDSFHQPIARLIDAFVTAFQENQDVNLEVFVHKAEALSEDFRIGAPFSASVTAVCSCVA